METKAPGGEEDRTKKLEPQPPLQEGTQRDVAPLLNEATLSLREAYLSEKNRIIESYGDLEDIRFKLGLNQRRLCKLLLVDPSAWTRWLRSGAPPHIYQALKWLLELKGVNPAVTLPGDADARLDQVKAQMKSKVKDLEAQIQSLERVISNLVTSAESTTNHAASALSMTDILEFQGAMEKSFNERIQGLKEELKASSQRKKRPRKSTTKKSSKKSTKKKKTRVKKAKATQLKSKKKKPGRKSPLVKKVPKKKSKKIMKTKRKTRLKK